MRQWCITDTTKFFIIMNYKAINNTSFTLLPWIFCLLTTVLLALPAHAESGELTTKPTQIEGFDLTIIDQNVHLNWTAFDHAEYYEVECAHEADEKGNLIFTSVGKIDANTNTSFEFVDNITEKEGLMYYRVKQVLSGNQTNYSEVKTANFINKDKFTLNVKDDTNFQHLDLVVNSFQNGQGTVNITALTGDFNKTESLEINDGLNNFSIDLPKDLEQGAYLITFEYEGISQVMLKQKVDLQDYVVSFE